ncbi:N-acetylmuramoyl-L-alanine amidase family protein [Maribacter polysaccharolyticus]|uniref:N-acetylmuramoyl-L-alanine amidase family protein n=1 Tax=Maribacter polysaccharolyticus TaxID=3020831 RepID=UPI00237F419D|nr:N-acetylmuramoyl-L-alanine amidase [Maribacter polysaccharolyticus]MDE3741177.1 N-acetylmuramoyl-L-alanine amidase [Maribacter polysaccharolyticus]
MLITLKFRKGVKPKNVRFRLCLALCLVILLFQCQTIFGQQKVVVIDPGHGGKDSGAIGLNGIKENEVVLHIAMEMLRLNNELDKPLDIYLTRYSDTLISLSDRTKLAKALKADLFVSLHCNHSDNPNARGIEVYVAHRKTKYSDRSIWLGFQLQDGLKKKLRLESRGVKFKNFQVLRETVDYCSSVLLELGFLSNNDESEYYQNTASLKALALVIFRILFKKLNSYERIRD